MPPRLIINADDFGQTPGINRAIIELHRAGVITSATLMATGSAFDDAVALARANPTLAIGCHLVFIDGKPLSSADSIPSLLGDDGRRFRSSALDFAQSVLRGKVSTGHIAIEALAQMHRLQHAGIHLTHFDTHKHTHLLPAVAETVFQVANQCGIRSMRNPFEPRWSASLAGTLVRSTIVRSFDIFARSFQRLARDTSAVIPEGTLGMAATGVLDAPLLRRMLDRLIRMHPNSTFEMLCHPGYNDAELDAQTTRLRQSREVEYATLLEVIPEYSRNSPALDLIHYGDLGNSTIPAGTSRSIPSTAHQKVL